MVSSTSLLVLGFVTVSVCCTSADTSEEDDISVSDDFISLMQTDVTVTPLFDHLTDEHSKCSSDSLKAGESGTLVDLLRRMWRWATQSDATRLDATESARRFHKDFIAAALLMTCVLPWSRSSGATDAVPVVQRLGIALPSSQYLRYLSIFLLWLKHYWFQSHQVFMEFLFVIAGAVFDYVGKHSSCEDDMWERLADCVPQRFARLYPFYALHVIGVYLVFFSSPCNTIETLLGGNLLLSYSCALGAWLFSLVFACYLVSIVLASPSQDSQSSNVAVICAGCIAMIVLPRTLAAPVHRPWAWSDEATSSMAANPDSAVYEMFFSRRTLLLGLAHYFLGLVLARVRLLVTSLCFSSEPPDELVGSTSQDCQVSAKPEADLWKAFEDEAKREMLSRFSYLKASDHTDSGHSSMSPRSNLSD